ncbi:MAG: response regulator [Endomicrobiia bacterium]|nr:response regulator [Endomicrobiaceae bacterium]MDD3052953.1 response regulator [Endomicrobiaceae bacterium]MDD3921996.1 response regulator [Endomicrobiaceae bacterium]MDD5101676.1 response regulator [Endomicrobiaceae bacterium]
MNKKVLIVDDEEEIVAFMARFLKRLNIDSVTAISGEEALEYYQIDKFDCVFLDIHLGGISGIDVLKKLKKINPNAKVIVITGSISSDNRDKVLDLGAIDYLQKPIDLADLKEKILNYI